MEYLRSLGTSLVQKSGLTLPFTLGDRVASYEGVYTLYDATKRDDGSAVSVFLYDYGDAARRKFKPFAQNALKKLRTIRHPDVLRFIDVSETDTTTYIVTERVKPLSNTLPTWSSRKTQEREDWLLWGLHRISVALAFINDSCNSTHGRISTQSIFISPSGEWKLGGFELLTTYQDESGVLYNLSGIFPGASTWSPPEVSKSGWTVLKQNPTSSLDSFCLGLLLQSVFNPHHPQPSLDHAPSEDSRGAMPISVFRAYKRLRSPTANRFKPQGFLELGMTDNGFFASNRLVKVCLGLENFSIASEADKNQLLKTLKESASSFPTEFACHKVLPSLVSALEFGGASAATILPLVLQFGKNVPPSDYPTVIVGPLVKLFASPDRGTRMALLEHLPEYIDMLDKKTVSDKIFPHLQTGFNDTVAVIREATTKSITYIAPKLSDRLLNNDLLRLLAKMQLDPEPSIRTNTCILLGRLGPSLGYHTKRKVLVPAFTRALKDSFVHARVAGLMSFMATIECFDIEDIATKVIPNVAFTMVDKEKLVRDQAFKAIELFVKKLEENSKAMPETVASEPTSPDPNITLPVSLPIPGGLASSAAGAAGTLAGWAISTIGKHLAASDLQSTMNAAGAAGMAELTPSPNIGELPAKPGLSASIGPKPQRAVSAPDALHSSTKGKGMQLGSKNGKVNSVAALAKELEDELDPSTPAIPDTTANPWGNDDLMDVNADADDWGTFETAPTTPAITYNLSTSPLKSKPQYPSNDVLTTPVPDSTPSSPGKTKKKSAGKKSTGTGTKRTKAKAKPLGTPISQPELPSISASTLSDRASSPYRASSPFPVSNWSPASMQRSPEKEQQPQPSADEWNAQWDNDDW